MCPPPWRFLANASKLFTAIAPPTTMPYLTRDNTDFFYLDQGTGLAVVFQHGLGSDTEKVFAQISVPQGFRLLGMDCRAHGKTRPFGEATKLCFDTFADDLLQLLDHLQIPQAVIGGTSMGAGVALNFALRYPRRALGLILLRPAWLDKTNAANAQLFGEIARTLRRYGGCIGLDVFKQTDLYAKLERESSDAAASVAALFEDPTAVETVERLEGIPSDAPNHDTAEWSRLALPTLVLGCHRDPIHPFDYARTLAKAIPGARFSELTPKCVSLAKYLDELRAALKTFLRLHFPTAA